MAHVALGAHAGFHRTRVSISPVRRNGPRRVWAGYSAIPASDAFIGVNIDNSIGVPIGGSCRADIVTGWFSAMHATDRQKYAATSRSECDFGGRYAAPRHGAW